MGKQLASRLAAWIAGALLLALSLARPALAADPLVSVDWVKANTGKAGVVFVDLRPATEYLRGHIPGAVNTDYGKGGWREDRADKVPQMLPAKFDHLADVIGKLGIDNKTHVVLVPPGASSTDMGVGTRIYWTFKVLGHDEVSILNGGMVAYAKDKKNPIETGAKKVDARKFDVRLRKEMIVTMDEVKRSLDGKVLLVDNRPEDNYVGINRHPLAKASGTLPGAKNLPNGWTTVNGGGQFRDKAQLEQLYKLAGVPTSGDQINFCNTGHWASVGWFVSSELMGNKKARLYDGSMTEWTMLKGGEVEQKVKLQ